MNSSTVGEPVTIAPSIPFAKLLHAISFFNPFINVSLSVSDHTLYGFSVGFVVNPVDSGIWFTGK